MKKEMVDFDNLTAEQVGKLFPIRIVPYNPDWIKLFEQEKELIIRTLGEYVLNIEHFGSTSVEGLAAKPTIDIMVEMSNLSVEVKQHITQALEAIGYGNMHNAEMDYKMTFGKGYDESYTHTQTYHIHIRNKGNALQEEIYFRDYLRQHSDAQDKYAELKYSLADRFQFNREDYTNAKTDFIMKITAQQKKEDNKMIETERLILMPLNYGQLVKYMKCNNSLEKELNLHKTSRTISIELKEALKKTILPSVADKSKNYLYSTLWIAISKTENRMIGDYCIHGEPNKDGEIEIGYGTYEAFQNRGYMTEIVGGIIIWVRKQPIVKSIKASTDKINIASIKVLEKNGFSKISETDTLFNWKLETL